MPGMGVEDRLNVLEVGAKLSGLEVGANVADLEAERLDILATEMRRQVAVHSADALALRLEEYLAGARAARRIAISIRRIAAMVGEKDDGAN